MNAKTSEKLELKLNLWQLPNEPWKKVPSDSRATRPSAEKILVAEINPFYQFRRERRCWNSSEL